MEHRDTRETIRFVKPILWEFAAFLCVACSNDAQIQDTKPGQDDLGRVATDGYNFRGTGLTYWKDVQPIYMEYCGDCHGGCTIDACAANSCFTNFYEATLLSAGNHGFNFAEWGLFRVEWTMARAGPEESWLTDVNAEVIYVTDEHIAIMRDWIYDGMEEGTPKLGQAVPEPSPEQ